MTGGLRVRALLREQSEILVLVLLVLAAVGGLLTYNAYAQPNTTTRTNEVTFLTASGSFSHQATVIDNESKAGPVFEPNQVVRNRSIYFRTIMPILNGTFRYGYTAESGELEATVRQRLVTRSVGRQDEERIEYWRRTEPLATERMTLTPGERVTVPFSVNVSDAVVTGRRISERLDDPGATRTSINVTVALSGTAGGQPVNRTLRYALPLRTGVDVYRPGTGGGSRPFTRTTSEQVVQPPGAVDRYGGPLLTGGSVLGLVLLVSARVTGWDDLLTTERAWLEYRDDRSDFDQWISTVRLPEEAENLPVAEADSLADLVDVAIDTDNAVLESPDGNVYSVVHGDYRYSFEAPPDPTESDGGASESPDNPDADSEDARGSETGTETEEPEMTASATDGGDTE